MSVELVDLGPPGTIKNPPLPPATVFSKFDDPQKFSGLIIQPEITASFNAVGQLTLQGNAAPDGLFYNAFAGVKLLGTVYPDPATGIIAWSVTYDNYLNAGDIAANQQWLAGIMLSMAQNSATQCYFQGYGMKTGGLQAQAWNGQFLILSQISAVNVSGGDANVPTTITVDGRISRLLDVATQRWCISRFMVTRDVGPALGTDPIPYSALNLMNHWPGLGVFLGVWYSSKTANGRARLRDFQITTGQLVMNYQRM